MSTQPPSHFIFAAIRLVCNPRRPRTTWINNSTNGLKCLFIQRGVFLLDKKLHIDTFCFLICVWQRCERSFRRRDAMGRGRRAAQACHGKDCWSTRGRSRDHELPERQFAPDDGMCCSTIFREIVTILFRFHNIIIFITILIFISHKPRCHSSNRRPRATKFCSKTRPSRPTSMWSNLSSNCTVSTSTTQWYWSNRER